MKGALNQYQQLKFIKYQKVMIRHFTAKKSVYSCVKFTYVRKKQIDEICSQYGNTNWEKAKMYTKMFAHIGKEGFKGAKNDFYIYKQLRNKPRSQFTSQDWNQLIRLYHDFFRLWPLFIIQVLPMSGPLFVLYMYTYPGSIPSWFIIDQFHEDYEKRIRVVQQRAIQYFKQRNIKPQDINFDKMTLQQARRLAECLYGYHRDGTMGFNKIFKRDINCIISEQFSKYLIKRKLKYKFNADLQHQQILKNMTFDQKIKWKYEQVMVHGKLLKDYEDSLPAQQLRYRLQQMNALSNMQGQGNAPPTDKQDKDNPKQQKQKQR